MRKCESERGSERSKTASKNEEIKKKNQHQQLGIISKWMLGFTDMGTLPNMDRQTERGAGREERREGGRKEGRILLHSELYKQARGASS